MATPNSSTKSSTPAVLELDLSDLDPFRSQSVRLTDLDAFITFLNRFRAEHGRPPEHGGLPHDRSCPAEFDLEHPERVPATYPAVEINQLFSFCEEFKAGS